MRSLEIFARGGTAALAGVGTEQVVRNLIAKYAPTDTQSSLLNIYEVPESARGLAGIEIGLDDISGFVVFLAALQLLFRK